MPDKAEKPSDAAKRKEVESNYAKFVAEVWANPSLRQSLLDNPAEQLKKAGFDVPQGKQIKIIELEENTVYFVLPAKPTGPFLWLDVTIPVEYPFPIPALACTKC